MVSDKVSSLFIALYIFFRIYSCSAHFIVLDTKEDIGVYWNTSYAYHYLRNMTDVIDGNGDQICQTPKVEPDVALEGFWSSCQDRKINITFKYDYPENPVSILITSYLEGRQSITISVIDGDKNEDVAEIRGTSWISLEYPLDLSFPWSSNSTIVFQTTLVPNMADFIERIEIEFPDLPTTMTPPLSEPTTVSTTEVTTSTIQTTPIEPSTTVTVVSSTEQASTTTTQDSVQPETTPADGADSTTPVCYPTPIPLADESDYWMEYIIYFMSAIIGFLLLAILIIVLFKMRTARAIVPSQFQVEDFQSDISESTVTAISIPRIHWAPNENTRFY